MNLTELDRALRTLRLSGMADVLDARLRHAQAERLPPLDLLAMLSTTSCNAVRIGSSPDGARKRASGIRGDHSTRLISASTRK